MSSKSRKADDSKEVVESIIDLPCLSISEYKADQRIFKIEEWCNLIRNNSTTIETVCFGCFSHEARPWDALVPRSLISRQTQIFCVIATLAKCKKLREIRACNCMIKSPDFHMIFTGCRKLEVCKLEKTADCDNEKQGAQLTGREITNFLTTCESPTLTYISLGDCGIFESDDTASAFVSFYDNNPKIQKIKSFARRTALRNIAKVLPKFSNVLDNLKILPRPEYSKFFIVRWAFLPDEDE